MKRLLLFPVLLLVIVSCKTGQTKLDGEKLILDYLQENTNGIEYSVVDISEPDSLYSPYELIGSLMISKSQRYAELMKQLSDSYNKPTRNERKAAASEVAELAYAEYHNFEDSFDIVHSITDPEIFDGRPANRVAFRAKFKVDGELQEDVFYLERDLSAVGHTASNNLGRYNQLVEINDKFFSLKKEAEQCAKSMR